MPTKATHCLAVWTYRGVIVFRAALNGSGIRWYTIAPTLRADTKQGMRGLIKHYLTK